MSQGADLWIVLAAAALAVDACGNGSGREDADAAEEMAEDEPGEIAETIGEADLPVDPTGDAEEDAVEEEGPPDVLFRTALSVSPFSDILFNAGITLSDGTMTARSLEELEDLLIAHGGTEVFARISTERHGSLYGEDRSLDQGVRRAELALTKGLPFNPELGLFGTYGDVSCQTMPDFSDYPEIEVPGSWETLTIDRMEPVLRAYGALAAGTILDAGADVIIWDVGNEVDLGTAGVAPQPLPGSGCDATEGAAGWYRPPDGVDPAIGAESVLSLLTMPEGERIAWLAEHVWPHEARLLAAAAEGVRSVDPGASFSTHISNSTSPTFAVAFYEAMAAGGFVVDEIGFSFYPSADGAPGKLTSLRSTVEAVQGTFGTPAFIAEFAYPAAPMDVGPFAGWDFEVPGYPVSEEGQAQLLRDLSSWAAATGVSGIRPWAPDVFRVDSGWGPMALFDEASPTSGVARPSLDSIAEGLAAPDPDALHE